jgi:tRNA threonylcarbamoyl adenosine modification protein YeaZ
MICQETLSLQSMNNYLPILAIETSGDLCSVALMLDKNSFVELNYLQKHIHSKKIIEMIDVVLRSAKKDIKDVKAIAVSSGPGSFTGLRIGFSAAKGLALGAGIQIVPVPTFNAAAGHICKTLPDNLKFIIATKASIEEIYAAKYQAVDSKYKIVEDVEVVRKENFENYCDGYDLIFGNIEGRQLNFTARSIAEWAYLFGNDLLTFDYDYLEPEYFGNPFLKQKVKVKK